MRVTQQQQCYDAESAALTPRECFPSVAAAQAWVDTLRDEPFWHLQGYSLHVLRIEVGRAKGDSVGWFDKSRNAGRIELAPTHLEPTVILHEVAHVLASATYGSKSHDPAWARTYLTLVSQVLGPAEYLALQRAFDERGVNYDVPRLTASSGIAL